MNIATFRTWALALAATSALAATLLVAGSAKAADPTPAPSPSPDPTNELKHFVVEFLNALNRLDVQTLVEDFAPGSETTVVRNGTITYGTGAIQAQAQRSIVTGIKDSLDYSVEDIHVTVLDPQSAFVLAPVSFLGHTEMGGPARRGGAITLVLAKRANKWLILHDHVAANCP